MIINIKDIIPVGWKFEEDNEKIEVWYENHKQKNPLSIILNKSLLITRELGELCGFWAGDGTKEIFAISNTDCILLRRMFNHLLDWGIGLDNYSLRISIPINFIEKKEIIKQNIVNCFPEISKIKLAEDKRNRNFPFVTIRCNKIMYIKLFKKIYECCLNNIELDNSFYDGYLSGIIAAEGHMDIRKKYNTLSRISIAQQNKDIREYICKILKKRNITYSLDRRAIIIFGKRNYDTILRRDLYSLHPNKKKQFLIGYNNFKQEQYSTKEVESKILGMIRKTSKIPNIAKELGRCRQTIREHLILKENSLLKRNLVKYKKVGRKGIFYFDITNKGLEYINPIDLNL